MTDLFSGEVSVHYGFAHLLTNGPELPAFPDVARRGQTNGLAGAAVAHQVHLITGLHTGSVAFTVAWSPTGTHQLRRRTPAHQSRVGGHVTG